MSLFVYLLCDYATNRAEEKALVVSLLMAPHMLRVVGGETLKVLVYEHKLTLGTTNRVDRLARRGHDVQATHLPLVVRALVQLELVLIVVEVCCY